MQKCPNCGFKTIEDHRVRDEQGSDRGSQSVCTNCDSVVRDDVQLRQEDVE